MTTDRALAALFALLGVLWPALIGIALVDALRRGVAPDVAILGAVLALAVPVLVLVLAERADDRRLDR